MKVMAKGVHAEVVEWVLQKLEVAGHKEGHKHEVRPRRVVHCHEARGSIQENFTDNACGITGQSLTDDCTGREDGREVEGPMSQHQVLVQSLAAKGFAVESLAEKVAQ